MKNFNPDGNSFQEVNLFELISALSFTTNKSFWDEQGKDYLLIRSLKEGSYILRLTEADMGQTLSKFFVGLFLFCFYIYENIGKKYISALKKSNASVINLKFFDGDTLTFDVHKFDHEMYRFFHKSLKILFSLEQDEINADIFQHVAKMLGSASRRFSREVKFLQDIGKLEDLNQKLFAETSFNINFMAIVLTAMPQNFLNSFFMLASNNLKRDFEFQTVNGIKVNAKAFFSYDTVDIQELYNKIKVLILLYQTDKELFLDMFFSSDIKEYMKLVFSDTVVENQIKSYINDTIEGQFLPRLDTIKAFLKIIA